MSSATNVSLRALPDTRTGTHPLNIVVLFFGVVLGAALCFASFGLDLSAGFF